MEPFPLKVIGVELMSSTLSYLKCKCVVKDNFLTFLCNQWHKIGTSKRVTNPILKACLRLNELPSGSV